MTLRRKTFLVVLLTLATLLAVLGLAARSVLGDGFARIERDAAVDNVQRVRDALAARIRSLEAKSADWGVWDDMHAYLAERSEAFRNGNLLDSNLITAQLTHLVLLGNDGSVIYQRSTDLASGAGHDVEPEVLALLAGHPPLTAFAADERCHAGVMMVGERPLLLALRPVLPSSGKGESRGKLVMGQWLDAGEVKRLGEVTHLGVTASPYGPEAAPEACRAELAGPDGVSTHPTSAESMTGYLRWDDLEGHPALLFAMAMDRDVHREGERTLRWLVGAILATGLALAVVIVATIERTMLVRLADLGGRLAEIGRHDDHGARVSVPGSDEIAALGAEINRTLAAKQRARQQILARSASMRLILDTIPIGLVALDGDGCIQPGHSSATIALLGRMDLAGAELAELLAPGEAGAVTRRRLADFLDMVRSGVLPEHDLDQINPVREVVMHHASGPAVLRCRFYRIEVLGSGAHPAPTGTAEPQPLPGLSGAADGVLVTLVDISDEKRLADEAQRSQEEYQQLKTIAEDVDLFREYLGEARAILAQCTDQVARLSPGPADRPLLGDLGRGVRAIDRGAVAFGMPGVATVAGGLETELGGLRRLAALSDTEVRRCRYRLADLEGAVASVEGQFRSLLGNGQLVDAEQRRPGLPSLAGPVDPEQVRAGKRRALADLKGLRTVPARLALARTLKLVAGMGQRRGSDARLVVEGGDTGIEAGQAEELNAALLHLVRNAFDHGFEPGPERLAAGKPEHGTLTLAISRDADGLVVELKDDGRGIDPVRLRQAAVLRGLISLEQSHQLDDAAALALIFRPGLTGGGPVSGSGSHGIGLDVVQASLQAALQATIAVTSQLGRGTAFAIRVPFRR
jgi:sensor domain CHASE-containing protein/signal transduction histidine kinase